MRITDVDPIVDGLISALMAGGSKFRKAIHRLRLCASCGKTFLALNGRTQDCSPACSNRRYQRDAYRKRREYERNQTPLQKDDIGQRNVRSLNVSLRAGERRK